MDLLKKTGVVAGVLLAALTSFALTGSIKNDSLLAYSISCVLTTDH